MTIAQALKEKNKKAAKLNKLWQRIHQHNVVAVGNFRPYNLDEIWQEIENETRELIILKSKIHAASAPVRSDIFTLSELKNSRSKLDSINVTSGRMADYGSSVTTEYSAHFGHTWKDQVSENMEKMIEDLQEKLDKFNHTTEI